MGIFSFNSKRVNKKDHLGKRQSLMWSITLAGYRRQVGDLVQMKADAKKAHIYAVSIARPWRPGNHCNEHEEDWMIP